MSSSLKKMSMGKILFEILPKLLYNYNNILMNLDYHLRTLKKDQDEFIRVHNSYFEKINEFLKLRKIFENPVIPLKLDIINSEYNKHISSFYSRQNEFIIINKENDVLKPGNDIKKFGSSYDVTEAEKYEIPEFDKTKKYIIPLDFLYYIDQNHNTSPDYSRDVDIFRYYLERPERSGMTDWNMGNKSKVWQLLREKWLEQFRKLDVYIEINSEYLYNSWLHLSNNWSYSAPSVFWNFVPTHYHENITLFWLENEISNENWYKKQGGGVKSTDKSYNRENQEMIIDGNVNIFDINSKNIKYIGFHPIKKITFKKRIFTAQSDDLHHQQLKTITFRGFNNVETINFEKNESGENYDFFSNNNNLEIVDFSGFILLKTVNNLVEGKFFDKCPSLKKIIIPDKSFPILDFIPEDIKKRISIEIIKYKSLETIEIITKSMSKLYQIQIEKENLEKQIENTRSTRIKFEKDSGKKITKSKRKRKSKRKSQQNIKNKRSR